MEVFVAALLGLIGLAAVLFALLQDAAVEPAGPSAPAWDPLPSRSDIARLDFPLRVPGYDPATVDLTIARLADAYADLLAEADDVTIDRARRRAQARISGDPEPEADGAAPPVATALDEPAPDGERTAAEEDDDAATAEALRTTVALEALRGEQRSA